MRHRLAELLAEYAEVESALADPAVHADAARARSSAAASPSSRRSSPLRGELDDRARRPGRGAGAGRRGPSFAAEAAALERPHRGAREPARELLVPADPDDAKDVILEIKAGEGGEESALFAGDLLRMYLRYAERQGWTTEVLDDEPSPTSAATRTSRSRCGRARPPGDAVWAAAEVRGRRAPRPAGPGHRVAGPHPHLRGRGPRATRRPRTTSTSRSTRTTCASTSSARPGRAGRASTPPTPRCASRTCPPASWCPAEREVPAAEPRAGACGAARPAAGAGRRRQADAAARGRAPLAGAHRRPLRAGADLQLPGEPDQRPPGRLQGLQPGPGPRRRRSTT